MAIYHMQAKVVSRGSGRSAVAASAYMSCSRMYNDYDGIQHDYTRREASPCGEPVSASVFVTVTWNFFNTLSKLRFVILFHSIGAVWEAGTT